MSAGPALVLMGVMAVGGLATALSSAYIVDEGRVGVVVRMGKAIEQESPNGLQFKTPFITGVKEFDVRERTTTVQASATTRNQLSSTVSMIYNLRPDPARIMEMFVKYGGPDQFMANIVTPRLNQSTKATAGQFDSVEYARDRDGIASKMFDNAVKALDGYPVFVMSAQLDEYSLPDRYWAAILDKEEQREKTEKEKLLLEQQGVQAKQVTQTAIAQAAADKASADAMAYGTGVQAAAEAEATRLKATAEADGIKAMQAALAANPLVVEYEKAKRWGGVLPSTILGESPNLFMSLPGGAR